jgi:hypothetical protein
MLAWLLENNLSFARKFLGNENLKSVGKAEREKHNFDLLVSTDHGEYVIENKVKSLPDIEQIIGYQKKRPEAIFILVSLIEPAEVFDSLKGCLRIVSYEQILNWISSFKTSDEYLQALVEDYGILISTLLQIKSVAAEMNLDRSLSLRKEDEDILRSIRLFDVAQKIRYSCFAALCDKRLDEMNLEEIHFKNKTEVALTRSLGLVNIKIRFPDPSGNEIFRIGIQIQGDRYRLFVESTDGSDVKAMAEELQRNELWLVSSHGACGGILNFGRIFKYSYFLIKGKTIEDVLSMLEDDIRRLFKNRSKIESLIKNMASGSLHSGNPNQAKP